MLNVVQNHKQGLIFLFIGARGIKQYIVFLLNAARSMKKKYCIYYRRCENYIINV